MFFNQGFEPFSVPYRYEPQGCQPDGREYSYEYPPVFSSFFLRNPVSGLKLPGAGTLTMSVVSSTITQPDASIIFSNGLLPFAANFTKERSGQR